VHQVRERRRARELPVVNVEPQPITPDRGGESKGQGDQHG
jgi:hypothetical protein